ncbi:MAG: adenine phosphoribosyltransferase [Parasphingopyxis sp.]|uniref:adenine phosphoribosyltransferase n=1 Tax=Parasphingopyxis sp. TaxID=1920299 RepID=UPI0026039749|nr:adenine phosphoribosyltransferase [uncultured Parasphingopyxis sp.]
MADNSDLKALVRTIPDYPKAGIQFRDITTLLNDADGFALVVERMAEQCPPGIEAIAAIEARGFLFGGALAPRLGAGLVPLRKQGKLPGATIGVDYALEYGSDRLEMHEDAVLDRARVLLVDDLIATGGTALAAIELLRMKGAEVAAASFVIDLPDLGGAAAVRETGVETHSLIAFEGD